MTQESKISLVIAQGEMLKQLSRLYERAFPENERKPLSLVQKLAERGTGEILAVTEETRFLGLAITLLDQDIVLIDYLAVEESTRGQGTGSKMLAKLASRYAGKRLLLEIEALDAAAENAEQRVKRKAFYLKNGYHDSGLRVKIYGIAMELLAAGENVSFEEYRDLLLHVLGPQVLEFLNLTLLDDPTT